MHKPGVETEKKPEKGKMLSGVQIAQTHLEPRTGGRDKMVFLEKWTSR